MNITSLVSNKIARATLAVAATGALAAAVIGIPGAAQAKSIRCDAAGTCKTYCTQSLPNGNYIEYEEGTKIIVTNADGKETTYTCKNGEWVQAARTRVVTSVLAQTGGKLSVASR